MLKWIGGCLGAIVVVIAIVFFMGYRQMRTYAAAGNSTVTIDAPVSRVFASIADADSLKEWRAEGSGISASHKGRLKKGDSIVAILRRRGFNDTTRNIWVVTDVVPDRIFETQILTRLGSVLALRRDSVAAIGDSTIIVSIVSAPLVDSLRRTDSSVTSGFASTMMLGALHAQTGMELGRLKARLEGKLAPPFPVDTPTKP